jgi:hypothetical protein
MFDDFLALSVRLRAISGSFWTRVERGWGWLTLTLSWFLLLHSPATIFFTAPHSFPGAEKFRQQDTSGTGYANLHYDA